MSNKLSVETVGWRSHPRPKWTGKLHSMSGRCVARTGHSAAALLVPVIASARPELGESAVAHMEALGEVWPSLRATCELRCG
jgi:hypothetical protein